MTDWLYWPFAILAAFAILWLIKGLGAAMSWTAQMAGKIARLECQVESLNDRLDKLEQERREKESWS